MIGIDTNVVVRYVTLDDPAQTATAFKLIDSFSSDSPGFISLIVIMELVWVLEASYHFKKPQVENVISLLLQSNELVIEQAALVSQALRSFHTSGADFADCLIERCGHAAECDYTVTFDKNAAAVAGMRLIAD
jgi:predicted nucleic-acid-binding protein